MGGCWVFFSFLAWEIAAMANLLGLEKNREREGEGEDLNINSEEEMIGFMSCAEEGGVLTGREERRERVVGVNDVCLWERVAGWGRLL